MELATEHEEVIRWLGRPQAYSHAAACVDHIETHISDVFLAGDRVYKLKKPVRFDFLDFSTVINREHACHEEVRLNRRLAPDAYLGVIPIVRSPSGTHQLEGVGQIIDWVVEMRRLPTELTLDVLHRRGQLRPEHIDRLAETLVRFFSSLKPLAVTAHDYNERCRLHVLGNLNELLPAEHHLPLAMVRRIHGFQLQLLRLRQMIFDERVQRGHIVDGHGDLRPEHICLSDPIVIFDCIEFNVDLRQIDVADELAFLASECDFIGADWVGSQLFRDYRERSGDILPAILVDFYKSYRACVRAKVAALRADQLQGEPQRVAIEEAQRHLSLADRYVSPWLQPLVVVVGGIAGTGKTTLAAAIGEALGAQVLRTDILRQECFGSQGQGSAADCGIYSPGARKQTYELLLCRAAQLHRDGISVVLDGTFSTPAALTAALRISDDTHHGFLAIECVCRPELAHQRIQARLAAGRDASDARPEIHDLQRKCWQPWPKDIPQLSIDTEQPISVQLEQVVAALATRPWRHTALT